MNDTPSNQSQTQPSGSRDDASDDDRNTGAADGDRDVAEFERVDWDEVGGWRRWVSAQRVVFVLGVLWFADLFYYYHSTDQVYLVWRWNMGWEDWLVLASAVIIATYLVVPLVLRPGRTRRYLGRLRGRWGTVLSLTYLTALVAVGFTMLVRGFRPNLTLDRYQPPVWETVHYGVTRNDCAGEVTGDIPFDAICHGSWTYPLGTHRFGYTIPDLIAAGARPSVYIFFVTIGIIVPLATTVGVVAGYYGGIVDDLLMAYVDVQLSLPAMFIYLIAYMFVLNSMFVFLVAFGLLAWGGLARIVRSETLQRREEGYVVSARAMGSSRWTVIRRHIVPNVTNSVVPATFHLLAIVILTEAGLSFLGFHPMEWSWGETIAEGLQYPPPIEVWWASTFPALALALTVVACKVAGDGLRDVLDPRGGQQ